MDNIDKQQNKKNSSQKHPIEDVVKRKVLFVDDDMDLGGLINMALTLMGYEVHFQNSLIGINGIIKEFKPDIIVLDVEIGKQNGIKEAKNIIESHPKVPIILVSSHTEIENITKGLSVGGVAFIKKPFEIQELDAYIKRFLSTYSPGNVIPIGLYSIELSNQKLVFKEEIVKFLSPMEKNALVLLIKNKNEMVSRDVFGKELWGTEFISTNEAALNNLISKLRGMINKDARISIETIKFKGYKLEFKD
jgi:DNA-binding response OmpR family regulator